MASTVVYYSPHVYEVRARIDQQIKKLCSERNIKFNESGTAWNLSREEKQMFYTLQISDNNFLIDNIKIIEQSKKTILFLDPEEEGIKLIKKINWQHLQTPVDKVSELSPTLRKDI